MSVEPSILPVGPAGVTSSGSAHAGHRAPGLSAQDLDALRTALDRGSQFPADLRLAELERALRRMRVIAEMRRRGARRIRTGHR